MGQPIFIQTSVTQRPALGGVKPPVACPRSNKNILGGSFTVSKWVINGLEHVITPLKNPLIPTILD